MISETLFRLGRSASVAVASTATASVALTGTQTRAVRVVVLGAASTVAVDNIGAFVGITSPTAVGSIDSTNGAFLKQGMPEVFKCNPGPNTQVEARGLGAVALVLYVTELS